MKITLEITEEQIEAIAAVVAEKLRAGSGTGEVLTVRQAAAKAQVGEETVRRWVRAGRLPRVRGTRSIRIPAHHLERLLLL